MSAYWTSRLLLERGLAIIYVVAFAVAVSQFVPLVGARGLLPATRFMQVVPFRESPSLFYWFPSDEAFRVAAWAGLLLALLMLTGLPQRAGTVWSAAGWATLWVLYLSFVNIGQTFYAFGWETLLLEVGFFMIFAGGSGTTPSAWLNWIFRWTLFRVMFGAGLIKMRGDPCWRNLTCLDYYFQTQPLPNPLSWYFHWLPEGVHRAGVAFNHFTELVVPFGYFLPQPIAGIAGLITIAFQLVLIVSGNLSWLNWLTIVLACSTLDERWFHWLRASTPTFTDPSILHQVIVYAVVAYVVVASIQPVRNMLSPGQVMNTSFNPLHLVNTYGAFGSVTRDRYEVIVEGTDASTIDAHTAWREYGFWGKPGDVMRPPPQVAPYHLRLDWLMWFAAFQPTASDAWFLRFVDRLLEGDPETLSLIRANPFPDHPPRFIRAEYYLYRFTTPAEHAQTGAWWVRTLVGEYLPPIRR